MKKPINKIKKGGKGTKFSKVLTLTDRVIETTNQILYHNRVVLILRKGEVMHYEIGIPEFEGTNGLALWTDNSAIAAHLAVEFDSNVNEVEVRSFVPRTRYLEDEGMIEANQFVYDICIAERIRSILFVHLEVSDNNYNAGALPFVQTNAEPVKDIDNLIAEMLGA